MNKTLQVLFMSLMFSSQTFAQKLNLVVGTYTNPGKSEGIYVYEFDSETGKFIYKNQASGISNPSYLTASKNGKFIYAVNEVDNGTLSAFTFDQESGALKLINSKPSLGSAPCYVSVDSDNEFVFVGNYGQGNFAAYAVSSDGALGDAVQVIQDSGGSLNTSRQEGPHVHSTILSPDEKFLVVSDLGTDKISVYKFDVKNKKRPLEVIDPPYTIPEPGGGPRHLDFHPNGKFVYSLMEMTGHIVAFSYNEGKIKNIQKISILAPGFKGDVGAADIHLSPDGNFLYASNRGDANDISIFSVNSSTGKLSFVGRHSSLGKTPRNFVIDPSGRFLLVANQNSNNIVVLKRDTKTGLLRNTGEQIKVWNPVCLKFTRAL